ncbi:MAG: DUF2460 domain-containing protein [Pseudomonadota bacterium]
MAFLDRSFPSNPAPGVTASLERRVEIVPLGNGREERNLRWDRTRRTFDAGLAIRSADELAEVIELFEMADGPHRAFRFRDWSDWRSGLPTAAITPTDQPIGTGDGTTVAFQLAKTYGSGASATVRPITKPFTGSVRVAVAGVEIAAFTLNALTGVVTLAEAPANGAAVTAGFAFDVPTRFAAEPLGLEMAHCDSAGFEAARAVGRLPTITLVEVIDE